MRRSLLFFLPICCTSLHAQLKLDSARTTWADTSRSFADRTIALAYYSFYDTTCAPGPAAMYVLRQTQVDTTSVIYRKQLGIACFGFGLRAAWLDDHAASLDLTRRALGIFSAIRDLPDMARCSAAIGGSYLMRGELDQAIHHLQVGVAGLENCGDTVGAVNAMENIAYTLQLQGDGKTAASWCAQALAYLGKGHLKEQPALYMRLGAIQVDEGDARGALATMATAQRMLEEGLWHDYRDDIGAITGEALLLQGDCDGALKRLHGSYRMNRDRADRSDMLAYLYARIARAHLCALRYDSALTAAALGLRIAEAHGLRTETTENLQCLAEAYEGKGDLRNALTFSKQYHALNDSLKGARASSAVTGALMNAEFQKQQFADSLINVQQREASAYVLQKERTRRNLLLIAGLVAVVFGTISYRQSKRTRRALHRSDELLLNILPEAVAEELKTNGEAEAKQIDHVTVLFTDFKGFTAMSEKLSPKDLVRDIHECFSAFDRICGKHGIEKIKTIGDAYMAAGGLPTPNNTHALDVVKAALEIRDFIAEGKALKMAKGLPYFEIRIGVHTGPVVAGIVGVKKFAYDIWGDTVNIASRMESSGEVGQVNISEATYTLVRNEAAFTFTARGKVQAKGKGEMDMYFVERGMDQVQRNPL